MTINGSRISNIRFRDISDDATDVYAVFQGEFERRWDIKPVWSEIIGAAGKQLFAAEFSELGPASYKQSVVLAIRNAYYQAYNIDKRWNQLKEFELREPILDYGCGVGYLCAWLKSKGFKTVYGYDLPGIQFDIAKRAGVVPWDKQPVNTILCLNVLEHIEEPKKLLRELIETGARVIANVDDDTSEVSHIASAEDVKECKRIIQCAGQLFPDWAEGA
jgi:SAM-dependent methyltransferase